MVMDFLSRQVNSPNFVFILAGTIAVVAIVFGTVSQALRTREREQTRREVAAYLAEGMIDSDSAEMLLRRGSKKSRGKQDHV